MQPIAKFLAKNSQLKFQNLKKKKFQNSDFLFFSNVGGAWSKFQKIIKIHFCVASSFCKAPRTILGLIMDAIGEIKFKDVTYLSLVGEYEAKKSKKLDFFYNFCLKLIQIFTSICALFQLVF